MVSEPDRVGNWQGGQRPVLPSDSLLRDSLLHLAGISAFTLGLALVVTWHFPLGWHFVAATMIMIGLIFAFVLHSLPSHPHPRFGFANLVTAFRASLVSLTGAAVLFRDRLEHSDAALWTLIVVVLVALALDGFDGYLARRYAQESELGARFDMEVDALLILILSVAAALADKAGAWVILIGIMRYGFVAAQWFLPKLRRELFASFRRKLVCVIQIVALCLVLMPVVEPAYSTALSLIALAMLIYSFTVDTLYLMTRPDTLR
ncbi:CDP-alcohol phosphatidyltransferase family protein [Rhizobium sp. CECT 9324]|uniref:CDP-alcohol phosphatidyltransferase family protein n=1 Tax=Rhizobium sp. CECT 9324 TaxID=2845820 RepID=UPI001E47667B|nr:CDP-alcohol phosphatidyltransferase family protein [Rhizobium sp. CECT 9324]CAH0342870.1 hypothetical protein RHI9324_04602 [Rhizobium sp. CECT 9324]